MFHNKNSAILVAERDETMDINQHIEDFQSEIKQNQDIAKQLYKLTNGIVLPIRRQQIKTSIFF